MIYDLRPGLDHIEEDDDPYDALLIEFDQYYDVTFYEAEIDYYARHNVPQVIEFVGDLDRVPQLNYLNTSPVSLFIISRRLVRVLESVRPFKYRLIPTVIYSKRIAHLVRNRQRRRTFYQVEDPSVRCEDFVILQLEDTLDCLDHERTIFDGKPFRECGSNRIIAEQTDALVLKEPEDGFPPIFYVPETVDYLFSEEAKQACDAAGFQELWWQPLPVPSSL